MKLVLTDAILIINDVWIDSFGRVKTNKKAISERGWYLYNRILLQHSEIYTTMTSKEREAKKINPLYCEK